MRRVGVVTFPGSNCDADFRYAVDLVDGLQSVALWHKDTDLQGVDAIVLPGGFSYGDYLRAGAIARFSPIMPEIVAFAAQGRPVLGVCNGFQILCEAGLLPGALRPNEALKFSCRDVTLRTIGINTPFTETLEADEALVMPIAHGQGAWYANERTLSRCFDRGQVVFRYVDAKGEASPAANPNGSLHNVAGVCNDAGNVVGLMPHPERAVAPELGSTSGLGLLHSLREVLA